MVGKLKNGVRAWRDRNYQVGIFHLISLIGREGSGCRWVVRSGQMAKWQAAIDRLGRLVPASIVWLRSRLVAKRDTAGLP